MNTGLIVHPEELCRETIDRICAAGIKTLGLHPAGGMDAAHTLQAAIDWQAGEQGGALIEYAMSKGLTVEYEAHALSWLLQRDLFAAHPDWFRMNEKGERTSDMNMCPSREEALAHVKSRTAQLARTLKMNSHRYFYWMDDASGGRCMCERCRALSASDQQMIVVNAMLDGLRTVDPQASIAFIAYLDTLVPPKQVQPAPGVFLEYAPIHRDPDAPMRDRKNGKNAAESAALPELLRFFGTEGAQVLEYWMDNSLYSGWKKPPKAFVLRENVMRDDVRFYRALGFESITSFGCYLGQDYEQLHGRAPIKEYGAILAE